MLVHFESNGETISIKTRKENPNFALVGRFDNGPLRVISIHTRAELANPLDVHNDRWTDIRVAHRTAA